MNLSLYFNDIAIFRLSHWISVTLCAFRFHRTKITVIIFLKMPVSSREIPLTMRFQLEENDKRKKKIKQSTNKSIDRYQFNDSINWIQQIEQIKWTCSLSLSIALNCLDLNCKCDANQKFVNQFIFRYWQFSHQMNNYHLCVSLSIWFRQPGDWRARNGIKSYLKLHWYRFLQTHIGYFHPSH